MDVEKEDKTVHNFHTVPHDWDSVTHEEAATPFALRPRRRVFFNSRTGAHYIHHSRAHRKNRYVAVVPEEGTPLVPPPFRVLPSLSDVANISWHVAFWFTLGSISWIVNGQYSMWPLSNTTANTNAAGYSALAGGLLFWVGAYLAVVEALNEKSDISYGGEIRNVLDRLEEEEKHVQDFVHHEMQRFKHPNGSNAGASNGNHSVDGYRQRKVLLQSSKGVMDSHKDYSQSDANPKQRGSARTWRWWGVSKGDLHSWGWWASVIQFTGATAFTISVISGCPGVLSDSQWQLREALVWSMQVFGSVGFIVSSLVLIFEEQRAWYKPALDRIGWHSAVWNLVGSIGFLLSASFGLLADWAP